MYTNTAATLYSAVPGGYQRTALGAVYWDDSERAVFLKTGVANSGSALILIPFSVDAEGRAYLPPKAFVALPEPERKKYFTIQPKDYIVKGSCTYEYGPEHPLKELLGGWDGVRVIQSADTHDQGSAHMRHWEVAAK